MALIKCPKCGREISDKAKKCVGCGWKVKLGAINLKEDPTISDNSLQKEKLTNESVKAMVDQKQKELELEYKKREEELAQQREALEMAQQELERTKKEQTPELQRDVSVEKKKNLSNINILLFMVANILIMLCFMLIVWRKLDDFSSEIEYLASKSQTESEMQIDETENEVEKKLEDSGEQVGLEDKNEKKELSDSDSKDENTVGDNDQQIETEENSKNVVSSNESVNDENYNVEFEYSDNKVTDSYVHIFVKITNKAETAICITSQKYFYINDISIESAFVKVDEEISSGKSALFEIAFERKKIEAAGISTINSLTCQYDIAEKANGENLNSDEITFEGLGININ